ncbi:hypothetical protein QOT17_000857 [Balamuthia mandrillaris]
MSELQRWEAAKLREAEDRKEGLRQGAEERLSYRRREATEAPEEEASLQQSGTGDDVSTKKFGSALLSPTTYVAHHKLDELARQLNSPLETPEVVILGLRGHGKTTLLEGLVGFVVGDVGFRTEGATKRPVYYRFINSGPSSKSSSSSVSCRILCDRLDGTRDKRVKLSELPSEIAQRMSASGFSSEPIYVSIHCPNTLDVTFIDTPGLLPCFSPEDVGLKEHLEVTVAQICAEGNDRLLLCVEEAVGWRHAVLLPFVKRVDPSFYRSVMVCTKLHSLMKLMGPTEELHKYFKGGVNPLIPCFWVTLPSQLTRDKTAASSSTEDGGAAWKTAVLQAHHRDLEFLRVHSFKTKFQRVVGVHTLHQHVMKRVWKRYIDAVPAISQTLKERRGLLSHQALFLDALVDALATKESNSSSSSSPASSSTMRRIANAYIALMKQGLEKVLTGSCEAMAAVSGQTRDEEVEGDHCEGPSLEWVRKNGAVVKVKPRWEVPFLECRLYGGQQFERLLAEFKAVVAHTRLPRQVTLEELVACAGTRRTADGAPDFLWAACDLAVSSTKDVLEPLLATAIRRAVCIMRRSFSLVARELHGRWQQQSATITENQEEEISLSSSPEPLTNARGRVEEAGRKSGHNNSTLQILEATTNNKSLRIGRRGVERIAADAPYFVQFVATQFDAHMNAVAHACHFKCLQEFVSTESVYAYYTTKMTLPSASDSPEDLESKVLALALEVYNFAKDRLARNILLRMYDEFLDKMPGSLEAFLVDTINSLSDAQLEDKFRLSEVTQRLANEAKHLHDEISTTDNSISAFSKASAELTVPLIMAMRS